MWSRKYSYNIIDKGDNYSPLTSNWVEDWYEFTYSVGLDAGLESVVANSFATHITWLMTGYHIPYLVSHYNEDNIRSKVCEIRELVDEELSEKEQKVWVFYRVLLFYKGDLTEYEKRVVSVSAHVPFDVFSYLNGLNVSDYVVEQVGLYNKDKTVKLEPYTCNKCKQVKECQVHFFLTPSEYELFRAVDGGSNSNKLLNLVLHDCERVRQRRRRLEIKERFFS